MERGLWEGDYKRFYSDSLPHPEFTHIIVKRVCGRFLSRTYLKKITLTVAQGASVLMRPFCTLKL
jgi:hypothetical protein